MNDERIDMIGSIIKNEIVKNIKLLGMRWDLHVKYESENINIIKYVVFIKEINGFQVPYVLSFPVYFYKSNNSFSKTHTQYFLAEMFYLLLLEIENEKQKNLTIKNMIKEFYKN